MSRICQGTDIRFSKYFWVTKPVLSAEQSNETEDIKKRTLVKWIAYAVVSAIFAISPTFY